MVCPDGTLLGLQICWMQIHVQSIYQFTSLLKIKVLVHLYPGKIVSKLIFENNVFAKIILRNFINIFI